ncbi:transporter [Amphritea balenae]|uniref:Transporter n=2 Tax=Amphritea balenae TaxID=452629 RepID=A0A3P1SU70_9GAMM|nr:transporter [Amphritea balenae]
MTGSSQAGTLADIYQQALAQDPQLKAAQAASLAGAEALPQGRAGLLPSLSLNGNTTWIDSDAGNYNNHGYTVSLSQPVFSAASWFSYKQGIAQSEAAKLQFDQAQQNLILRVTESYLEVLRAQTTLETSLAEERAIMRRLDQVNAQFEVGLIAITDVHEAQASFDNAKVARILAEGNLDNSYQALERLIGQPISSIDSLDKAYPIENISPSDPDNWVEKARSGNLALKVAVANTESARRQAQTASSGHLPTIAITASHDRDDGTASGDGWTETNQVGLTLSMPLFSGGATSSQSRQAEYSHTQARFNQEDTQRAVIQDTRSLWRNIRTDVLSVAARQRSILSSETALKATEEGFNVGTRNVVDVLQAEQQLYAAQRDYANARYNYVQDLFRFKQQIGTLNPDDLIGLDQWMKAR